MSFVHDDGRLILARWAGVGPVGGLWVDDGERSHAMYGTTATGEPLVSNGSLGVDLIRVPAGGGFAPHTHPGDHLLIVIAGRGTITYEGRIYPTGPGTVYMVEGAVPHAVGAIDDHCILAVGSPHRAVDAADRMALVEYHAVASSLGALECLACGGKKVTPQARCEHFPAEAGEGRLLFVGLAPADEAHRNRAAFDGTASGRRLAALLDVDAALLVHAVDTVNLSRDVVPDWSAVPAAQWREHGRDLLPRLGGRVVVACGRTVAAALGVDPSRPWGSAQVAWGADPPALVVLIPHPSGLSRSWNEQGTTARASRAIALARTLARTGPRASKWDEADATAFDAAMS